MTSDQYLYRVNEAGGVYLPLLYEYFTICMSILP